MITVDTSRFPQVVSSDDFEDDLLISMLSTTPRVSALTINDHSYHLPGPTKQENLTFCDYDISLIPYGNSEGRAFEFEIGLCFDCRLVTRLTPRPISFLDMKETPGLRLVFDYAGLIRSDTIVPWVNTILSILVTSGGAISVCILR